MVWGIVEKMDLLFHSIHYPANPMRSSAFLLLPLFALAACQTTPPAQPDRFAMMDSNKDSLLSRDEVNDFYTEELFTGRDTNKDGHITKAEWNPEISSEDAKKFAVIDSNKDGKVTLDEAKAYARKKGTYTASFDEADTNKDGSISRTEAVAYFASKEGPVR